MIKICECCNKKYNAKKTKQKYCSVECKRKGVVKIKEKICPNCGNKFKPKNSNVKQKYCSLKCKKEDKKAILYVKVCKQCGKKFKVTATYKDNIYCSKECSSKALDKKVIIICKNCGKEKKIVPSQVAINGNFCDAKCKGEYFSKIGFYKGENNGSYNSEMIECSWCGKPIKVIKSVLNKNQYNYCSRKCMAKHYEIRFTKENSPSWKGGKCKRHHYGGTWFSARRKARKRDKYICQLCGKTEHENGEQLSVHHINPFRNFNNENDANNLDNLICLCRRCHDFVHSKNNIDLIYLNDIKNSV